MYICRNIRQLFDVFIVILKLFLAKASSGTRAIHNLDRVAFAMLKS
jgi:hypothetical protein